LLNNMAVLDLDSGRFAEARDLLRVAIVWQRKALGVNPGNPVYRQYLRDHLENLLKATQGLDLDDEAAEVLRELDESRTSHPGIRALDARLAAILKGGAPKDNAERLTLAQHAYDTKRCAAAAKLWAEALEDDLRLAEDRQAQHPYNAACAAALAASGRGVDDPPPDEDAKVKLREQSLGCLKSELTTWSKLVESGPPQARAFVAQTLEHWQRDADLAGVRDAEAIEGLPESGRDAWRALWAGVEDLLAKAKAGGPDG
jgi:hypothetical protein